MTTLRSMVLWFDPRRRLIASALAAWVVLVVAGAGERPGGSEWIGIPDLGDLMAASLGLSALVGLAVFIVMRPRLRGGASQQRERSKRGLLLLAIVVIVMAVLAYGGRDLFDDLSEEPPPEAEQEFVLGAGDAQTDGNEGGTDGGDIATLLIVAVIAAGVLVWSGSRSPQDPLGGDTDAEPLVEHDLSPALDEATALLVHGSEPRSAVLAAYATLERALAERGHGRHLPETPTEHLARVLADDPGLAPPAIRLGALYELARFSDREITLDDQRSAAVSLDRARHELATPVDRAP
jgi:hypothetical protein